ncbi:MAG: polysaccharide pyruvyl transferase family protein [Clostridia bacterium]|nr:polysaccharide pyruvyl transferase family protein [Clostridia bacterium]
MNYFLFDHAGSLNRGCEAIIRGTQNIINLADPSASYRLASFRPETDSFPGTEIIGTAPKALTGAEKLISAFNVKLLRNESYALRKMYSETIESARGSDYVLSVGGDTYCYGDNAAARAVTAAIHKNGQKTVLWGASIGKEDLSADKITALKSFDAVFARESITYEMLGDIIPEQKLYLFADPAFCMEREDLPLPDGFEEGNTLGFNLSSLVAKKNPQLLGTCIDFLKKLIENTTLQIALIPHVTESGNNDMDVLQEIYQTIKDKSRLVLLPDDLNAMQYKGYIARTRFFIGARTHATIAAYSNGVPTIVLGYSVKSKGISKDLFSEEKFVLDISDFNDADRLFNEFSNLVEQESEIKETLINTIPLKIKSAVRAGEQLLKI